MWARKGDSFNTEAERNYRDIFFNSPLTNEETKDQVTFLCDQANYSGPLGFFVCLFLVPFPLGLYGKDANSPNIHSFPFAFGERIF